MDGGTEGQMDGGMDGETDGWIDGPRPYPISMGQRKKDVTPLLMHWSYIFLALTRLYGQKCAAGKMFVTGVPQTHKHEIMQYMYHISHNIYWVHRGGEFGNLSVFEILAGCYHQSHNT